MSDLVILDRKSGIPVMDSRVAARELGIEHQNVRELLQDHTAELGVIRFETGSKKQANGRCNPKPEKYALLTERQALLLITMVRNSPEALVAKERLVDAFLTMRAVLQAREVAVAVRRELTDSIQGSPLNEAMHGWAYKQITDLIYRVVLGMDAKRFREAKGLPKDANVREHLTQVQAVSVERLERLAGSMVDLGADYARIKIAIAAFGVAHQNRHRGLWCRTDRREGRMSKPEYPVYLITAVSAVVARYRTPAGRREFQGLLECSDFNRVSAWRQYVARVCPALPETYIEDVISGARSALRASGGNG